MASAAERRASPGRRVSTEYVSMAACPARWTSRRPTARFANRCAEWLAITSGTAMLVSTKYAVNAGRHRSGRARLHRTPWSSIRRQASPIGGQGAPFGHPERGGGRRRTRTRRPSTPVRGRGDRGAPSGSRSVPLGRRSSPLGSGYQSATNLAYVPGCAARRQRAAKNTGSGRSGSKKTSNSKPALSTAFR